MSLIVKSSIIVGLTWLVCVAWANNCSESEFPCDDDEQCIPKNQWCDTTEDCLDYSDEFYCHISSSFRDPNFCLNRKFVCANGPCIPHSGRCDGVSSCTDNSDEEGCYNSTSTDISGLYNLLENSTDVWTGDENLSKSTIQESMHKDEVLDTTAAILTTHPQKQTSGTINELTTKSTTQSQAGVVTESMLPLNDHPGPKSATFLYWKTDGQEMAKTKAEQWLLKQSDRHFGKDIARLVVSLHLSNETFFRSQREALPISNQLQLRIAVDLLRNETNALGLSDLSLYVNALLAIGVNPSEFHGVDLARDLRLRTNLNIGKGKFISPAVFLTLCIMDKGSHNDIDELKDIFVSRNNHIQRLDIQAFAVLAASCYSKDFPEIKSKLFGALHLMLETVRNAGFSDISTTALLLQAFDVTGVTSKEWKRSEALEFLLRSQKMDGSFGNIQATYYAMQALLGNELESLKKCNAKWLYGSYQNKVHEKYVVDDHIVHITLAYENPVKSAVGLQMRLPKNTTLLDALQMAGDLNSYFRVEYDQLTASINSVGDAINDPESGMFWDIYITNKKFLEITEEILSLLVPNTKDIRTHVLQDGTHIIFWFRRILTLQ